MNARRIGAFWFLSLTCGLLPWAAVCQSPTPVITGCRIEGTNVVITAQIPPGIRAITLEGTDRLGRLSWAPRAVTNLDGTGASVSVRVPMSRAMEAIRIRANATQPLPAAFFQGTNSFSSPYDSTRSLAPGATDGPVGTAGPTGNNPTSVRDVVESDIWQIRGTRLYFFNQYRGLQVVDISNPDTPFLRGTLPLPAAGDQMYLLSSNHVVLLAREGCDDSKSQVLVVADTNGTPSIVAQLPLSGTIVESRLVGTALYVASQTFRPARGTTNTVWEWGTMVSAFDLSNPGAPVARNTLWFSGYGNVVSATDTYLFVVTQAPTNWWQSIVNLVDITDPAGTISAYGSITTAGQVIDKFKLNYSGSVFAAISEDWHASTGSQLMTRLETFHLPDPRSAGPAGIVKLGELDFGLGERLHATRFDSNRLYVVTFLQIDPLWVVDLTDPTAPKIAGSVAVPGWSTYIEPLGNQLITMGIETNHVAVSLFDVTDPSAPSLLSRVRLGANFSWSEANYDEKAFTVLPDAGLLLVPFSSDATNGYTSVLQLIDYNSKSLTVRGQIQSDSGLSYRRATLFDNRILSLTDWELVTVNATDRDNPVISGRLELAVAVDRVLLSGNYLLELSGGNGWNLTTPTVSVAAVGAEDQILTRLDLMPLRLLGAAIQNGRLYLAQATPDWNSGTVSNTTTFGLTVLTLTNLPSLSVISQSLTNIGPIGWSTDWQALWPKPDILVWAGGQDFWWWCDLCPLPVSGGPIGAPGGANGVLWWPYWRGNGGNGHLVAFDAANPDSPVLASQVDLTDTNRWGFSRAFLVNSLVYLSHQTSEFVPPANPTNSGTWVFKTFLDVVDLAMPADPLVRDPVSIPNQLVGVDNSGALLFSVGAHWNTDPSMPWREYLDASAYDGVSAHLVDSLALSTQWPQPVLTLDTNVLVADPGDYSTSNTVPPALVTWAVSDVGKFVRLGSLKLASPVSDLAPFPGLVATAAWNSTASLFDDSNPAALRPIGAGNSPLCWWWPDLQHADGSSSLGLWLPLGPYGVFHVPDSQ